MLPKIKPHHTRAWKKLEQHHKKVKRLQMNDLFAADPDRFKKFSLRVEDILFDYSKNRITEKTMHILMSLAEECGLDEAITAMFSGDVINETEHRAVLHTALRNVSGRPVYADGKDVMPLVQGVLQQMKHFCNRVHSGEWTGYTGKKIRYIVNIGIGGSDLGPYMATEALRPYWLEGIEAYFVSNVDGTHI